MQIVQCLFDSLQRPVYTLGGSAARLLQNALQALRVHAPLTIIDAHIDASCALTGAARSFLSAPCSLLGAASLLLGKALRPARLLFRFARDIASDIGAKRGRGLTQSGGQVPSELVHLASKFGPLAAKVLPVPVPAP